MELVNYKFVDVGMKENTNDITVFSITVDIIQTTVNNFLGEKLLHLCHDFISNCRLVILLRHTQQA